MLKSLIGGLDRFNTLTTELAGKVATIALVIMTTVVTIHVFMRYGFNYSFHWTEEVARNLMVWMTFLYFPTGHKKGMNIAVEFAVTPWVQTAAGQILKILIEILSLFVLCACLWLSFGLVERGMGTSSQALQITMGYIYLVVPVCFGVTILCALENLLRLLAAFAGVRVPLPAHEVAAGVD